MHISVAYSLHKFTVKIQAESSDGNNGAYNFEYIRQNSTII